MAALLAPLRFPSLSPSPNAVRAPISRRLFPSLLVRAQAESEARREKRGLAVVWLKHDLRIDDHSGMIAAAEHSGVVPLYIFDHRILRRFSDEMLEMIVLALDDLRDSLRSRGSNLMVKFGNVESVLPKLVKEINATHVYAEEEVEYDLNELMGFAVDSLKAFPSSEKGPEFVLWRTPFYNVESLMDIPDSYKEFEKLQVGVTVPLPAPDLPCADVELKWGQVPTLNDLMRYVEENSLKKNKSWTSMKELLAESVLLRELSKNGANNKNISSIGNGRGFQKKRAANSVFVTREGSVVGGGTNSVLNALAAYLRYLEGTTRDDWKEVHEKVIVAEDREGASFTKLFGPAISLGIVSKRRVLYEAAKYEKERNTGFFSPFGNSMVFAQAAFDAVCSMEWYRLMSLKSRTSAAIFRVRVWRWKNHLIQYTVAGNEGPAIFLVHGFGAFLEHYRDNVNELAKNGNRVWAVTLLGFGKSEKPNVIYSELMWAELLRDFIVEVVGEPVHLVGNSIGGYFVSILARLWPALAKSVVLINSAGNIVPGYSPTPFSKERVNSGAARLGARLLSFYLRSRLKNILQNCYPTRAERIDDELVKEMLRASNDPGVLIVLESIFSFNLSLPLNYLLKDFAGKVLVIQGMKDPISDSKSKLSIIREHCDWIAIKELDAGHCPHDEVPELVNSIVCEWLVSQERKVQLGLPV